MLDCFDILDNFENLEFLLYFESIDFSFLVACLINDSFDYITRLAEFNVGCMFSRNRFETSTLA